MAHGEPGRLDGIGLMGHGLAGPEGGAEWSNFFI